MKRRQSAGFYARRRALRAELECERMKCALVCCECGAILMEDGSKGPIVLKSGVLDFSACSGPGVAVFPDKAAADAGATKAGWKAIDGNHRCPSCDYRPAQRSGMYVFLPEGK